MDNCLHSEAFLKTYKGAQQVPRQKYDLPVTEAQEIGWESTPLVIVIHAHSFTHTKIATAYGKGELICPIIIGYSTSNFCSHHLLT